MSLFGELIRIKRLREDKAERQIYVSRQAALRTRDGHMMAKTKLQQMLEHDQLVEKQLYAELFSRQVRVRDIHTVHHKLAYMRQCEMQQEQVVEAAAKEDAAAQVALTQAREGHHVARQQTSKFIDLAASFDAARQRESDRLEDLEMEEVVSARREREDWDHYHPEEEHL